MRGAICIVSPGNLASNPRLLKEADALHEAGYGVTTVVCDYTESLRAFDDEIAASVAWKVIRVPRRPDERLAARETGAVKRRIYLGLQRAIAELPPDDRRLIRMWTELKVADIARILGVEQKPLYRRIEKILGKLKKSLERQGIRRQDIEEVLGSLGAPDLDF